MVKVGFLAPGYILGGAERWTLGLARCCDPERIQWVGLALTEWAASDTATVKDMTKYMPVYGPPKTEGTVGHDFQYVKRMGPDAATGIGIIAAQADIMITWTGQHIRTMLGYYRQHYKLKVLCVSHGSIPEVYSSVQDDADCLAAVSKAAVISFREGTRDNVEVVYNGADIDRCTPILGRDIFRKKFNIPANAIVLGYIGRFSPEKNPLLAARTAAHMGKQFRAMYVGGGCDLPMWADQDWVPKLQEVGGDQVHHIGPQDSVGDALAASDVIMCCSYTEGFSLGILEAWLAGVPVISTGVGAIPELEAMHGQLVVQVSTNPTVEETAEAVAVALSRANKPVIDRARSVAWNHYTLPAMAERWTNYMERVATK